MREEELRTYFNIYTDCWKLFRKYSNTNNTDEYWESLIAETDAIVKKYNNSELAKKICLATINELERIEKEK